MAVVEKKFYPGDVINYTYHNNLTIISEDDEFYTLRNENNHQIKVRKTLINKYGEIVQDHS